MDKREERKMAAAFHIQEMAELFSDEINKSIILSKVLEAPRNGHIRENAILDRSQNPEKETEVEVKKLDTVSAILEEGEGTVAMNFASHISPCGGYIQGAMAQEEALATESTLYNVLSKIPEYYKGKSWEDNAMINPGIIFRRGEQIVNCDIITCAAVDRNKYHGIDADAMMYQSIDNALSMALFSEKKTLVTGAFGCGVFGNDATMVAKLFMYSLLYNYNGLFDKVVFAVPDDENYQKMREVIM